MAEIIGSAKKYNNEPANFVLIFDWITGTQIASVVPDVNGAWSYFPLANATCGIAYVAHGCKPITHGPYTLIGGKIFVSSGFLAIIMAGSENHYNPAYDVSSTGSANWVSSFDQTKEIGLFNYVRSAGTATAPNLTKTIDQFTVNWVLQISGGNGTYIDDSHKMTLEILDKDNVVLAAIKTERNANFSAALWYGKSLTTLTRAGSTGQYLSTQGTLTFTPSSIIFTPSNTSNYNHSFTYSVPLTTATKIRVGGTALSTAPSGSTIGGFIKVLSLSA